MDLLTLPAASALQVKQEEVRGVLQNQAILQRQAQTLQAVVEGFVQVLAARQRAATAKGRIGRHALQSAQGRRQKCSTSRRLHALEGRVDGLTTAVDNMATEGGSMRATLQAERQRAATAAQQPAWDQDALKVSAHACNHHTGQSCVLTVSLVMWELKWPESRICCFACWIVRFQDTQSLSNPDTVPPLSWPCHSGT